MLHEGGKKKRGEGTCCQDEQKESSYLLRKKTRLPKGWVCGLHGVFFVVVGDLTCMDAFLTPSSSKPSSAIHSPPTTHHLPPSPKPRPVTGYSCSMPSPWGAPRPAGGILLAGLLRASNNFTNHRV